MAETAARDPYYLDRTEFVVFNSPGSPAWTGVDVTPTSSTFVLIRLTKQFFAMAGNRRGSVPSLPLGSSRRRSTF